MNRMIIWLPEPSGETVTESQNKKVSVSDNHSVTVKCTATFVTRYNASKKRRFITQIKSAKRDCFKFCVNTKNWYKINQ